MKEKVHKIVSLILISTGAFLAFSCSTYEYGFLQSSDFYEEQEEPSQMELDLLIQKKEDLNSESQTILNSIKHYHDTSQPFRVEDINHLFQNLKNQYKIDSCFQYISMYDATDSVKWIARQNLIMAADFYNANFQQNKWLRRIINAESTQEGVIFSNSHNFAEGNSFVIIRPKFITNEQNKRMLQVLKAQIGKNYDFNFNVESPDLIFCTELIYLVYEQIFWKTKRIVRHFTISPDQIVLEALGNNNLFIPLYSKKGQLIKNPNHLIIKQLIQ